MAYRESENSEYNLTKLREAAETERTKLKLKEQTKQLSLEKTGMIRLIGGLAFASILVFNGFFAFSKYLDVKYNKSESSEPTTCHEAVYARSMYTIVVCANPLHVLVTSESTYTCKCGTVKLP